MTGLREAVAAFLAERDNFITAIKNCHPDNRADYWRWQGHAEARRVFREALERDGIDLKPEPTPPAGAVEADEAPLGKPCSCFARDPLPGRWHYPVCSYYREPPAEPTPEQVEAASASGVPVEKVRRVARDLRADAAIHGNDMRHPCVVLENRARDLESLLPKESTS